jgi:hypothetical protein
MMLAIALVAAIIKSADTVTALLVFLKASAAAF